MNELHQALSAKSDQLNAVDIMGVEPVIRIREVKINLKSDQPLLVYFDGDNNKPWKPSKGMGRILMAAWGDDYKSWAGRYAQIYFEPSVKFGGAEVGGIRVRALSDIPEAGLNCVLALNRAKRVPYHVPLLTVSQAEYPEDRFLQALPVMKQKMVDGEMTLQQVIAQCQKTGQLTAEQLKQLEESAPVETPENDDDESY